MRDIRFRAWDNVGNKWIKQFSISADGMYIKCYKPTYVNPDAMLMQYTGLLDKNGVEIYEGDIVIYPYSKGLSLNMKVVWLKHGWFITDETVYYRPTEWSEAMCEVIGNIYESPELLGSD